VRLECLTAPVEIVSEGGQVTGVKCRSMTLGAFDRSGRRSPTARGDGTYIVKADQVIAAIGQSLDPGEIINGTPLKLNDLGFFEASAVTGRTSVEWIFAGGDAVSGPSSVVSAIAAGERAAVGMDAYLSGETHAFWRKDKPLDTFFDPDADPVDYPRARIHRIPVDKRRNNFREVERPWAENIAIREARRCLRCDFRRE